jgi:hypothetical protein
MGKNNEITKGFKFAHRGCDVVEYKAGDVIDDATDEMAELAIKNKWAKESKAKTAAPENKDAAADGGAPENKSE